MDFEKDRIEHRLTLGVHLGFQLEHNRLQTREDLSFSGVERIFCRSVDHSLFENGLWGLH